MVPSRNLTTRASHSCVDNKGGEHGPFRLNASNFHRDLGEALLPAGFKDRPDKGLNQTLLTNPHDALGPTESLLSPPPPVDLTHHQVVICDCPAPFFS